MENSRSWIRRQTQTHTKKQKKLWSETKIKTNLSVWLTIMRMATILLSLLFTNFHQISINNLQFMQIYRTKSTFFHFDFIMYRILLMMTMIISVIYAKNALNKLLSTFIAVFLWVFQQKKWKWLFSFAFILFYYSGLITIYDYFYTQ